MNSVPDWAASAQQWMKAIQLPQLGQLPNIPQVTFDPTQLEELQQAYIREAA